MNPMNLLDVTVVRKAGEAEDICSFELARADGAPLPPFSAGAHIDVHVGEGLVRQYSLCNPPHERQRYVIGVLRDAASRGGSRTLHDAVHEGARLRISAPKNLFPLAEAKRSVLLAGGIGVTPLLAMAESLAVRGADFTLHYCSRSPQRTAFRERLVQAGYAGRVQFHYDSGPQEQRLDLATLLATPDPETHLYVCGPGGFIAHVTETAKARGWPAQQVHYEYFAAPASASSAEQGGEQPFNVTLARSGGTVTVPAGRTVTAVLAEHGVRIPVACEQGVCGTCVTRVLQGEPDHRDVYLTDEERADDGLFTPCCSRAKSGLLVLDL